MCQFKICINPTICAPYWWLGFISKLVRKRFVLTSTCYLLAPSPKRQSPLRVSRNLSVWTIWPEEGGLPPSSGLCFLPLSTFWAVEFCPPGWTGSGLSSPSSLGLWWLVFFFWFCCFFLLVLAGWFFSRSPVLGSGCLPVSSTECLAGFFSFFTRILKPDLRTSVDFCQTRATQLSSQSPSAPTTRSFSLVVLQSSARGLHAPESLCSLSAREGCALPF